MADETAVDDGLTAEERARRESSGAARDALLVESLAHTAANRTSPPKPDGNYRFGARDAALALRLLADMIDARKVAVQDIQEGTRAYCDDFTMTALTVVYAKRIKE